MLFLVFYLNYKIVQFQTFTDKMHLELEVKLQLLTNRTQE